MFAPNKRLGQNFLHDTRQIKKMVNALEAVSGEIIVEIGPGLGALTTQLVETYGTKDVEIRCVEIDPRFVDKLKNMFAHHDNVEIVEADILNWLPRLDSGGKAVKVIGSLPYYITSPILYEIVRMREKPETCVILVQKEVAQKILSKSPNSVYLSVLIQTYFEVESLGVINKDMFTPAPEVDGGVLKLTGRKETQNLDARKYIGFLKKVFANPRKMLNKTFHEDELNRSGLDGKMRPQNYGWKEFSKAFRILV